MFGAAREKAVFEGGRPNGGLGAVWQGLVLQAPQFRKGLPRWTHDRVEGN